MSKFNIFKMGRHYELLKTYQRVFDSEDGQEVLQDLMKRGFILNGTSAKCTNQMNRDEGKRELVLYILKCLDLTEMKKFKKGLDDYSNKMNEMEKRYV